MEYGGIMVGREGSRESSRESSSIIVVGRYVEL